MRLRDIAMASTRSTSLKPLQHPLLRHLVIRDERPASAISDELEEEAADAAAAAAAADAQLDDGESDAAPAAVAVDGE